MSAETSYNYNNNPFFTVLASAFLIAGTELPARTEESLRFSGSLSLIEALQHDEPLDNSLSPQKKLLDIPLNQFISEVRPSMKVRNDQIQLVFRPRFKASYNSGYYSVTHHNQEATIDSWISDAFLQWELSPWMIFAYGRQNYQWGPAEAASPSNRIFHETARERGILYQPDGKNLIRFNLNFGQKISTVAMVEYEENKDEAIFMADTKFAASALIKPEINWNGGADYFGLVFGGREHGYPWVGEYCSLKLPLVEELSPYGGAAQQHGSYAWYPRQIAVPGGGAPSVTVMDLSRSESEELYNFYVIGSRYDFVGGSIFRVEYISQEAGHSKEERELVNAALASREPNQIQEKASLMARYVKSGLELPGREYWFASLHSPDIFRINDLTLYLRALYATSDESSSLYSSLEYKVGSSGTILGSALTSIGDNNGELRGPVSSSYALAYKMDW